MADSSKPPSGSGAPPGDTVMEHSLPREWRDRLYGDLGSHPLFVADVIELVFGPDWVASSAPGDLERERELLVGAEGEKAQNDLAWSTPVRSDLRDGTPARERVIVAIEIQSTVDRSMPFRVMRYEGMRYAQLQRRLQEAVECICTVVIYTEEQPWKVSLAAGELIGDLMVERRPLGVYDLVDLHRLEAEPGTRNLVRLLAGVVQGDWLENLARALRALAERVAELGDPKLERTCFALVRALGNENWPEFDWFRCESLDELVQQLEEGEMTWPEKWKRQMGPQWKEEMRPQLEEEIRPEVRAHLEAKLRPEVEADLEAKLLPRVEARLREQLLPKIEQQLRDEARGVVHGV